MSERDASSADMRVEHSESDECPGSRIRGELTKRARLVVLSNRPKGDATLAALADLLDGSTTCRSWT
jgi:hypothetical protein